MRVRSPGSSANIGPGFDVLGFAVSRYVWLSDEGQGEPCPADHIGRIAYERAGGRGPVWCNFELEPSRGLGFSAAARAAGAYLASRQNGLPHEEAQDAAYTVVEALEGHGDNAAPATYGGFWVIAGDMIYRLPKNIPGQLLFWVPDDAETSTDESRSTLPSSVPRADAVFNLGRLGLLVAAIYDQRLDLLAHATQDQMHQPIRLQLSESSAKAYQAALSAGAAAAWLSGSGPTVAIVADEGSVAEVERAVGAGGTVLRLDPDVDGVIEVQD